MSKVDDVFGSMAAPLIQEWGQPAVFIQADGTTYDPDTGAITKDETRIDVKIVITKMDITESGGLYQEDDVKILIDPDQLSDHYVNVGDYFEVPYDGGTQQMKVVDPTTYRGENPVFFVIIARPQ